MNTCQWCGMPLQAIRSSKKYCSAACKQNAYLKRISVKYGDNHAVYGNSVTVHDAKEPAVNDGNNRFYDNPVTVCDDKQSFYERLCKVFNADGDKPEVRNDQPNALPVLYAKSEKAYQAVPENDDNYQWIVPELFTRLEGQMNQNGHRNHFRQNGKEYFTQKLNTQWKSILHEILRLSYHISIDADEFIRLYNAVIEMEDSSEFRCCSDYPYKSRIAQITSKWSVLLDEAEEDALFTIIASLKQTALQMLCEIGDTVKYIPFDTQFKHLYEAEEEE